MKHTSGQAQSSSGGQGFRPSEAMIRAAETLFLAMAMEGTVRPVVEKYKLAILAKHQFPVAAKWREYDLPEKVLDLKWAFLLSEEDSKVYFKECFDARDTAGLKVSRPGNCPLLEAEEDVRQAQNAFIKELGTMPGLENLVSTQILTLEQHAKLIDLGLRLVAPFVSNADQLLQRVMATPLRNA